MDDLYRMLRNGHLEAPGIVDTLDAPIAVLDEDLHVVNVSPAFCQLFRVDREDAIGPALFDFSNGPWESPELRRLLGEIVPRAAAIVAYEVVHDFPGIGERTMLVSARRLRGGAGGRRHIMVQFEDVTERRDPDAARDLLLSETRHRARNLFALAHALARETEADGFTGMAYRDAFIGRFQALLKGQALQEEVSAADFHALARQALEPLADRVRMDPGPVIHLAATQIMPMVMVLHELMTNATTHGALSTAQGMVRLSWTIADRPDGRELEVNWLEEGGPSVAEVGRRGFGSRLMQFGVTKGLGGVVQFNFEPAGLRVSLSLPVP